MERTRKISLFYKFFSLLSVVRIYNILVLVIAQYLVSIYIFSSEKSFKNTVNDPNLFFVVFATICVVAGGYIINNFYDKKAYMLTAMHDFCWSLSSIYNFVFWSFLSHFVLIEILIYVKKMLKTGTWQEYPLKYFRKVEKITLAFFMCWPMLEIGW